MKNIKKYYIKKNLLNVLFSDLFSHIGWSNFYKKYVLVEPIWYIKNEEDIITDFICIDDLIYNFNDSFGKIIANIIDENASEFIEQAFIEENKNIFICDNPILFPHDRVKDFHNYFLIHKDEISQIGGLIHFHLNEKDLNEQDIKVLSNFFADIAKINAENNYLGMIISQKNLTGNNNILENENNYINYSIHQFNENNISLSGKLFQTDEIVEDCNILIR